MEEKIIRPTTKPEAIKGKLLKYQGTDYCEFLPQAQGEPQYEGISRKQLTEILIKKFELKRASIANFISRNIGESFIEENGMIRATDDAALAF